jgi:hypothetical protein
MNNLLIIFVILVPLYVYWRFSAALKAKVIVAKKVDDYLESENRPEILKRLVFCLYEDSLKPFIVLQIFFYALFLQKNENDLNLKTQLDSSVNSLPEDNKKEFLELVDSILLVNVRLAPFSYLFVTILLTLYAFIKVIVNRSVEHLKDDVRDTAEDVYIRRVC